MKKLKHLFTILLTILCITNVSYAASLDYGLYNVKNDVYHEQEIGMNMARTYLNQTMRVDAKTDGTYYYTVEFSGTEYMNKHRILVNGSQVSTTKKSNSSKGTVKLTFKVKNLNSKIKAKLYVDAMGRDVEFQIIPDFSTAQCVQKYSKKENTKTEKTDKTNKKEDTKSDSKKENSKKEESKKESTKSDSDKSTKTEKVDSTKDSKKDSEKESDKTESTEEEKAEESKEEKTEEVKEETDSNDSEKVEEKEESKTEEKTETEKVSAEKTDEKKSSKMPLIIGCVAVLAVIGAVVVFTKKRK